METVFKLKASELDNKFLNSLRTLFRSKEIEITIRDMPDETSFLLSDSKNREYLLRAVEAIQKNKNLVRFSGEEFEALSEKLVKK